MRLRPLGLWNDNWRVYAVGVLLFWLGISATFGVALWATFPEPRILVAAIVAAVGASAGMISGLWASIAYRVINPDWHWFARWLGFSLVNGVVPAALLLFLFGWHLLVPELFAEPLIAVHVAWSAVFLIGRRPRPPRQPLPQLSQPVPRGWDSRH